MKRICAILLCFVLLLAGCSAPAEQAQTQPQTQPEVTSPSVELTALSDGKTLKVLAIGNSFSNNTTQYLYDIAAAEGVTEIVLGRLYIGACTLDRHISNAENNKPAYTYYKNTTGTWEKTEATTLLYGLTDEDWDIITMQQASGESGQPDSYKELPRLIEYVNQNKTNPSAKLVWHMTWAYQSDSTHADFPVYGNRQDIMYQQILESNRRHILTNDAFIVTIPAGTAIQNARTSYLGDHLTADGYHLNDLGKVITGYLWYATFTGKTLDKINLTGTVGPVKMTEELNQVIIESVNNALRNPMEVTPSQYAE